MKYRDLIKKLTRYADEDVIIYTDDIGCGVGFLTGNAEKEICHLEYDVNTTKTTFIIIK